MTWLTWFTLVLIYALGVAVAYGFAETFLKDEPERLPGAPAGKRVFMLAIALSWAPTLILLSVYVVLALIVSVFGGAETE